MNIFDHRISLTSNQHGLVVSISQHVSIGIIRNRENVWRHFILSLSTVDTNNMIVIYGEPFVWIDGDTEETRISVNHESFISFIQVIDDSSFGEVGHIGQIFQKFVFWGILAFEFRFLNLYFSKFEREKIKSVTSTWWRGIKKMPYRINDFWQTKESRN